MAFGMAGIKILSGLDKLITNWRQYKEDTIDANALADLVSNGNLLLQFMAPEVKSVYIPLILLDYMTCHLMSRSGLMTGMAVNTILIHPN